MNEHQRSITTKNVVYVGELKYNITIFIEQEGNVLKAAFFGIFKTIIFCDIVEQSIDCVL